jgi:Lrp/AsnC family leucine-responsive transcriptional regulator
MAAFSAWLPLGFRRPARPIRRQAERLRRVGPNGCAGWRSIRHHRVPECVNPARAGLPLTAFVQLRCRLDHCVLKTSKADNYPEVVEVHKLKAGRDHYRDHYWVQRQNGWPAGSA